jgi:hypothetical protein
MKLAWDERKNRFNIRKHGFDFSDAEELFASPAVFRADTREDYGEERWQGIGLIRGRTTVVVFAIRGEETFRLISLRRATRRERAFYEKEIKNRLGSY